MLKAAVCKIGGLRYGLLVPILSFSLGVKVDRATRSLQRARAGGGSSIRGLSVRGILYHRTENRRALTSADEAEFIFVGGFNGKK